VLRKCFSRRTSSRRGDPSRSCLKDSRCGIKNIKPCWIASLHGECRLCPGSWWLGLSCSCEKEGLSDEETKSVARVYVDRVAGGDCDYRHSDRAAVAGRATGAGGRAADAVQEQPEADRVGAAQLSRRGQLLPAGNAVRG